MAKIEYGAMVGSASGSVGGTVFSRNRYGTYMRRKGIPVNPDTAKQQNVRAALAGVSASWRGLTAAQRLQWSTWAANNPIVDRMGNAQVLAGNAAYIQLNTRIVLTGEPGITAPPVTAGPDVLATMTLTGDIGIGTSEIAYTATPLGADEELWVNYAVVDSAGINYVKNLYKLCTMSAAAQASPYDFQSDVEARFGSLQVGQIVHVLASVFDHSTGLISLPRSASVTISST